MDSLVDLRPCCTADRSRWLGSFACLTLLLLARSALAQTIINFDDLNVELPGISRGKVTGYWLAPYVRVTTENIGKRNVTTVTWFGENGEIKRTTEVQSVQPGYVTRISRQIPAFLVGNRWTGPYLGAHEFRTILQGVNEDWRVTLPKRPWITEYVTVTSDSRLLMHQYQPTNGQVALDVYLHGNLVTNIGPYAQYRGESVQLGDDGSAALPIWKDAGQTTAQIVVVGPDGHVRFRVDCEGDVGGVVPGPDGSGVLVSNSRTCSWYTLKGKAGTLDYRANGRCAGWIPGSHKCVFDTSIGDDHKYRLVDCDTAKDLWEVPSSVNGHVLAIGCTTNYVLLAVAESYMTEREAWFRNFYALNATDGKTAARWVAPYPKQIPLNQNQRFLRLPGKLYYLTPDEFAEIREDEITAKTNHWYPVTP